MVKKLFLRILLPTISIFPCLTSIECSTFISRLLLEFRFIMAEKNILMTIAFKLRNEASRPFSSKIKLNEMSQYVSREH